MTEHYFSRNPQSKSEPKLWSYQIAGTSYNFTSDIGVFSKNEVDFGTSFLIENFKEPTIKGSVLDLGCGYGPIGIAIADIYENREIVMADINERAVELSKKNIALNHIENAEVIQSDRFSSIKGYSFASILTNPPIRAGKKVIYQMFEESKEALLKNGELWVVIQKKQGAASTMDKLEDLFGNVEKIGRSKGYFILRSINSWPSKVVVVTLLDANMRLLLSSLVYIITEFKDNNCV